MSFGFSLVVPWRRELYFTIIVGTCPIQFPRVPRCFFMNPSTRRRIVRLKRSTIPFLAKSLGFEEKCSIGSPKNVSSRFAKCLFKNSFPESVLRFFTTFPSRWMSSNIFFIASVTSTAPLDASFSDHAFRDLMSTTLRYAMRLLPTW